MASENENRATNDQSQTTQGQGQTSQQTETPTPQESQAPPPSPAPVTPAPSSERVSSWLKVLIVLLIGGLFGYLLTRFSQPKNTPIKKSQASEATTISAQGKIVVEKVAVEGPANLTATVESAELEGEGKLVVPEGTTTNLRVPVRLEFKTKKAPAPPKPASAPKIPPPSSPQSKKITPEPKKPQQTTTQKPKTPAPTSSTAPDITINNHVTVALPSPPATTQITCTAADNPWSRYYQERAQRQATRVVHQIIWDSQSYRQMVIIPPPRPLPHPFRRVITPDGRSRIAVDPRCW